MKQITLLLFVIVIVQTGIIGWLGEKYDELDAYTDNVTTQCIDYREQLIRAIEIMDRQDNIIKQYRRTQ